MKPTNSKELRRNYKILFAILLCLGLIIVLQSYNIGQSILLSYLNGFDIYQEMLTDISWIVVGSIISLISGFAFVTILLKDIESDNYKEDNS
ncbi:MAG: hypothetical protein AAGU75_12685 [Bacillota bacterium]